MLKRILLVSLLMAGTVHAQEGNQPTQVSKKKVPGRDGIIRQKLYRNQFEIGLIGKNWHNEEFSEGKTFMKDYGNLYGARFQAQAVLADNTVLLRTALDYATGRTTYEGGLSDGTPLTSKSKNTLTTLDGIVGIIFVPSDSTEISITPYSGFYLRTLMNPKEKDQPGSYDRKISQTFLPIGLETKLGLSERTVIGFDLRYSHLLWGTVETHLSDVHSSLPDLENDQKKGKMYSAQASFTYLADDFAVSIKPFYNHVDIADSEIVTKGGVTGLEPHNKTDEYGLEIAFSI